MADQVRVQAGWNDETRQLLREWREQGMTDQQIAEKQAEHPLWVAHNWESATPATTEQISKSGADDEFSKR